MNASIIWVPELKVQSSLISLFYTPTIIKHMLPLTHVTSMSFPDPAPGPPYFPTNIWY